MFSQTIAEIFYCVLNMSILGAVAGLCLLALRLILRKIRTFPRFGVYLLWSLPFLRFCLPLSVASKYSLLNLIPRYKTVTVWEEVPQFSFANSVQAAESYSPIVYKTDLLKDVFTVGGTVWAIIAAGAVLTAYSSRGLFCRPRSPIRTWLMC